MTKANCCELIKHLFNVAESVIIIGRSFGRSVIQLVSRSEGRWVGQLFHFRFRLECVD